MSKWHLDKLCRWRLDDSVAVSFEKFFKVARGESFVDGDHVVEVAATVAAFLGSVGMDVIDQAVDGGLPPAFLLNLGGEVAADFPARKQMLDIDRGQRSCTMGATTAATRDRGRGAVSIHAPARGAT